MYVCMYVCIFNCSQLTVLLRTNYTYHCNFFGSRSMHTVGTSLLSPLLYKQLELHLTIIIRNEEVGFRLNLYLLQVVTVDYL